MKRAVSLCVWRTLVSLRCIARSTRTSRERPCLSREVPHPLCVSRTLDARLLASVSWIRDGPAWSHTIQARSIAPVTHFTLNQVSYLKYPSSLLKLPRIRQIGVEKPQPKPGRCADGALL